MNTHGPISQLRSALAAALVAVLVWVFAEGESVSSRSVVATVNFPTEPTGDIIIRPIEARDRAAWEPLWDGYIRFYERAPREDITRHLWNRMFDPASPVHGIVADDADHGVIGLAHYVIHENTSQLLPVCYLQDLYVDADVRALGAGKLLIDWLVAKMQSDGWPRLYWNTKENNYRARGLYDKDAPRDEFIRYSLVRPAG